MRYVDFICELHRMCEHIVYMGFVEYALCVHDPWSTYGIYEYMWHMSGIYRCTWVCIIYRYTMGCACHVQTYVEYMGCVVCTGVWMYRGYVEGVDA